MTNLTGPSLLPRKVPRTGCWDLTHVPEKRDGRGPRVEGHGTLSVPALSPSLSPKRQNVGPKLRDEVLVTEKLKSVLESLFEH